MKIRTIDGAEFAGETPAEVLHAMHMDSFSPEETDEIYMRETARRAEVQTGRAVSSDNPDAFLKGLVAAGLAEMLED